MYASISSMQDLSLSRIGMKNVSSPQSFTMPRPQLKDGNGDLIPDKRPAMTFESKAQLAFHLPNSFNKRVWLNLETVKLAYHLFDFVIGSYIKQPENEQDDSTLIYGDLPKCEYVIQYLLKCLCEQGERRMYVEALADICLLFDTLAVIPTYASKIIIPSCVNGQEKQFLALVQQHTYQEKDKLSRIASAYNHFDGCRQVTTYSSWRGIGHEATEKRYQCIRCFIFQKYLSFKSMQHLKEKLALILHPKATVNTQNKNEDPKVNEHVWGDDRLIGERPKKKTRSSIIQMNNILSLINNRSDVIQLI